MPKPLETPTSTFLHFIRALSAQMVVVGHGFNFGNLAPAVRPPNFIYIQNLGVVIFFVMSGFVITLSIFEKQCANRYGYFEFAFDRLTRFLITLVPCLFFIWGIDLFSRGHPSHPYIDTNTSLSQFIGNIFILQGYPHTGIVPFGSARPLWTISLEWFTYLFFGFFLLAASARRLELAFGLVALVVASKLVLPNFLDGRGLALAWMIGSAGCFLIVYGPPRLGVINLFALAAGLALLCPYLGRQVMSMGASYSVSGTLSIALALVTIIFLVSRLEVRTPALLYSASNLAAGYSFSLYCIHYSVFVFLLASAGLSSWGLFWTGFVLSNLVALAIASVSEFHYRRIREAIKMRLLRLPEAF